MSEDLSALVDGELPNEAQNALLEILKQEPELQGKWTRYHLIRTVLRNKKKVLPLPLDLSLASRVRCALSEDKTAAFETPLFVITDPIESISKKA